MEAFHINNSIQPARIGGPGKVRSHAILASVGTDGDVYPFLALGVELRRRGYRVTLATHEHFARDAHEAGLEFAPLVSASATDQLLAQGNFWHPFKGAVVIARWGARLVPGQYATLKELSVGKDAFLVASPGVIAARLVQEHDKVPLISVILQPWIIPSVDAPPVMMGGLTLPHCTPRSVLRLYFRLIDQLGIRLMGVEVRQLRASLGLKPMRGMFRWWFSPVLILGLFPEWFGAPQPDWPPQVRLAGFPLKDGRPSASLPEKLMKFCRGGKPAIAFTFGTGMRHATEHFQEAVEVCRLLGRRAVLVTTFRSQVPAGLPDFAQFCEFAPFQDLFPLCEAVVHHGGIGTVAKALAAGTPQLILPFAFDQLDNALRVKRLGAGNWLKPKHGKPHKMAAALANQTTAASTAAARSVAARLKRRSGVECAADHIEAMRYRLDRV